jgi:hypothetical protein
MRLQIQQKYEKLNENLYQYFGDFKLCLNNLISSFDCKKVFLFDVAAKIKNLNSKTTEIFQNFRTTRI